MKKKNDSVRWISTILALIATIGFPVGIYFLNWSLGVRLILISAFLMLWSIGIEKGYRGKK